MQSPVPGATGAKVSEARVSSALMGLKHGRLASSHTDGYFADFTMVRLLFQKQSMFMFVFLKLIISFVTCATFCFQSPSKESLNVCKAWKY